MSRVLIIGGGVAGLTAGIYSLKYGHEVTICEQHRIAGGNLTGWNRNGYHIDNCVHWLTGTNPHSNLNKIWRETGALGENVKVVKGEKLYTYVKDGQSLSLWRDVDKMTDEMLALSPEDEKKIKQLNKDIKSCMYLNNVGGPNHDQHGNGLRKLKAGLTMLRCGKYSVEEYGKLFKSPVIQGFFRGLTGSGFSMAAYTFVASTYCSENADLSEGGSFAMAAHMAENFRSRGGKLLTSKKAVKVNLEGNTAKSVTFADGETLEADWIILCMDPAMIYGKLLDKPMPKAFKKMYKSNTYQRFSAIHAAFEVDAKEVPFTATRAVDIPEKLQKTLKSDMCLVREFSHEKSYYPEGKNVIQTLIYQDEETSLQWIRESKTDKNAYNERKAAAALAQLQLVEETIPELKGRIKLLDSWTPATYNRFVGSEMGSFMTFKLPKKKPISRIKSTDSGAENLLLATQWQLIPGGVPMAALAGVMAARNLK